MAIDFQPQTARTSDGAEFTIRMIRRDDFSLESAFIRSLSEASRYFRLMYTLKEPPAAFVRRLVNVDGDKTMALAAVTEIEGTLHFIGVVRYGRNPDGRSAEFAIAVADDWQQRGVATQLMTAIAAYAKRHRIERFEGQVLAENKRMLDLCRWLKFDLGPSSEGGHVVTASKKL